MAQHAPPAPQLEFHGVFLTGNPTRRPPGTASKCLDLRVMPGYWLRLRGGRKARYNIAGDALFPAAKTVMRLIPFRQSGQPGAQNHYMQLVYTDGTVKWHSFIVPLFTPNPLAIDTIATAYDNAWAKTNMAAGTQIVDRPILYNGLGVRDGSGSRPPFSSSFQGVTRYYGLDNYVPGGTNPKVNFAAGGGYNQIANTVTFYVGFYASQSGHYSNPVNCGTLQTTGGNGTITITNLQALPPVYHNAAEQGELQYCFYATDDINGGTVPYLILDAASAGPYTVPSSATSASLSLVPQSLVAPNGFTLNLAAEAPNKNYPPRPMTCITYVNGRLYGALLAGGSGPATDFQYQPSNRDLAAVVWSMASSDSGRQNIMGDPLESWPFTNIAYTPSSEVPLWVSPAQDNVRVLVNCPTSTYLLQETADGVHEWITVSRTIGMGNPGTLAVTQYGTVWATQHKEIVLLPAYSNDIVRISRTYESIITGNPIAADYVYDPINDIDRYQLFCDDQTSVCHDFALGAAATDAERNIIEQQGQMSAWGEAYSTTTKGVVQAAATLLDLHSNRTYIYAIGAAMYSHEGQPDSTPPYLIPTTDQTFTGTAQQYSTDEIYGEYDRNWSEFGDSDIRKTLPWLDIIGDGEPSPFYSGSRPIAVDWYSDFQALTDANKSFASPVTKAPQSSYDYNYRFKLAYTHKFWYKFVFRISGHSPDDPSYAWFTPVQQQGDVAKNFYGSILRVLYELEQPASPNRP